jgi:hypothetical protein
MKRDDREVGHKKKEQGSVNLPTRFPRLYLLMRPLGKHRRWCLVSAPPAQPTSTMIGGSRARLPISMGPPIGKPRRQGDPHTLRKVLGSRIGSGTVAVIASTPTTSLEPMSQHFISHNVHYGMVCQSDADTHQLVEVHYHSNCQDQSLEKPCGKKRCWPHLWDRSLYRGGSEGQCRHPIDRVPPHTCFWSRKEWGVQPCAAMCHLVLSLAPCQGRLQGCHMSSGHRSCLPVMEGSGTATCIMALDPTPHRGALQCCHVSNSSRPCLPPEGLRDYHTSHGSLWVVGHKHKENPS